MPNWNHIVRARLAVLRLSPQREGEIVEEIALHLEAIYDEALLHGLSENEAQTRAVQTYDWRLLESELSRVEPSSHSRWWPVKKQRRGIRMESLLQDLRFGARMLRKQPGFTLIAILTLALGIGANTTIFSFLNALLLRPWPGVADQQRLALIGRTQNGEGFQAMSYPDYRDYGAQNSTFVGIAAESEQQFHLGTDQTAERIKGALVSGNYFDVLGIKTAQGRLLRTNEGEAAQPVAVISERLWRKEFGAESVTGKTISLNAHPYTIIGVAAGFQGTSPHNEKADIWIPIGMWRHGNPQTGMGKASVDWLNQRDADFVRLYGRLKPGVTLEQAQADLSTIAGRLAQAYPGTNAQRGARVFASLGLSSADAELNLPFFAVLFGVVGLVLLIACANLAGLMLARTTARQKEIGVRLALGAGRFRIVRQLLAESLLLALLGGAAALVVAAWEMEGLRGMLSDDNADLKAQLKFALDWRVLAFTLGLAVVTGMLFGLLPALHATKLNLTPLLKDAGGSLSGQRRTRLRSVLVVAQIALSLILLVSAGLCVRTLQNAQGVNLGFTTENLLTARLDPGRQNYSEAQGHAFYRQLLERMSNLPGVEVAGLAMTAPLQGGEMGNSVAVDKLGQFNIRYNVVTPTYLDTMGIPLLLGRRLGEQDNASAPRVAIINETFARHAWPNESPVGKFFTWKDRAGDQPVEVIGVMRDARSEDLLQSPPRLAWFPLAQKYEGGMTLHLRTAIPPEQLLAAVRQELRALDAKLPITNVKTLEQYRRDALAETRMQTALIGGFGLLALVLASLGLYGVLAYSVAQRTQEIGVRMALGAQRSDVMRLVIWQGMKLIAVGLLLGLAGALAATQVLQSMLFGVSPTDPLTFGAIAVLLMLVALLACWIPARRATKVDPLIALRCD